MPTGPGPRRAYKAGKKPQKNKRARIKKPAVKENHVISVASISESRQIRSEMKTGSRANRVVAQDQDDQLLSEVLMLRKVFILKS